MSDAPRSGVQRRRDTEQRLADDIDLWVASASADGVAVPGAAVLRLGRRGAAAGHADGQPDRPEPGRHPTVRLGLGQTRDVTMIEGDGRGPRDRRPAAGAG